MTRQNMKKKNQVSSERSGNRRSSGKKKSGIAVKILAVAAVAAIVCVGAFFVIRGLRNKDSGEATYREEPVTFGSLTVGITEDGTIAVGTSEQTFELDLSAYSGSSSTTSSAMPGGGGMPGGGMDMGGGMSFGNSSSGSSSGTRTLTVENVLISEGQEIHAGDPIANISEDSLTSIRTELEEDVNNANLDLQEAQTSEKTTTSTASTQTSLWQTYGTYAQAEYDSTVLDLQEAIDEAQEVVDDDNENLTELQEELAEDEADLVEYQKLVDNAEYVKANTNQESDLYNWVSAENTRESSQQLVDDTEDEIDALQDEIDAMNETLASDTKSLNAAKEAYDSGVVTAKAEYDTKMQYYNNASSYNTKLAEQGSLNTEIAQTAYDEAQKKLDEFDSYISDNQIISQYDGTVESVNIAEGDALSKGSSLFTVTDSGDLSIDVSVSSDDIASVSVGDTVRIYIDSYPDTEFTGTVDEIGDSSYNSSTGETDYAVTIDIDPNDADLYSGMSAQVTFITKDAEDVLYIPNRAVTRENGKSYVLKKDADGKAVKTEVTTGFSDGTNVQVVDGLSEGDTVLIETQTGA